MTASHTKPRPIHEIRQEAIQTKLLSSAPPPLNITPFTTAHPQRGTERYNNYMHVHVCLHQPPSHNRPSRSTHWCGKERLESIEAFVGPAKAIYAVRYGNYNKVLIYMYMYTTYKLYTLVYKYVQLARLISSVDRPAIDSYLTLSGARRGVGESFSQDPLCYCMAACSTL